MAEGRGPRAGGGDACGVRLASGALAAMRPQSRDWPSTICNLRLPRCAALAAGTTSKNPAAHRCAECGREFEPNDFSTFAPASPENVWLKTSRVGLFILGTYLTLSAMCLYAIMAGTPSSDPFDQTNLNVFLKIGIALFHGLTGDESSGCPEISKHKTADGNYGITDLSNSVPGLQYLDEMVEQTPEGLQTVLITNKQITPNLQTALNDRNIVWVMLSDQ